MSASGRVADSVEGAGKTDGAPLPALPDLVASCAGENRARMERHLHRLRGFRFALAGQVREAERTMKAIHKGEAGPET